MLGLARNEFSRVVGSMLCAMLSLLTLPCVVRQVYGQITDASARVAQVDADRAVQSLRGADWYDRSDDDFAPPDVSPATDVRLRREGWLAKEKASDGASGDWFGESSGANGGSSNFRLSGLASDWFSAAVLVLLGSLLLFILLLLSFHSLKNYLPARYRREQSAHAIPINPARVIDLPFELEESGSYASPLDRAEALMRASRFREAIVFLYGYQLLALDQSRKIELRKGKTNRMYLRELKDQPTLCSILEQTMLAFEDAYFGRHEIESRQFAGCWQSLAEFHRLLDEPPAVGSHMIHEAVAT